MAKENRIGAERVRLGFTQGELGEKIGVTSKSVSQWETGRSACPAKRLVDMSQLFGCTTDWLLGLSDKRPLREEWNMKKEKRVRRLPFRYRHPDFPLDICLLWQTL